MEKKYVFILIVVSVFLLQSPSLFAQNTEILAVSETERVAKPSRCFTQGLYLQNGIFFESCGLYGKSEWRSYQKDGKVIQRVKNNAEEFAEGFAPSAEGPLQLFWKKEYVKLWSTEGVLLKTYTNPSREAWGLAEDHGNYWFSDGSAFLSKLNQKFEVMGKIEMKWQGRSLQKLNELEAMGSLVLANQWQSPYIYVFAPPSPQPIEVWDTTHLWRQVNSESTSGIDVPNGIAWDREKKELWITGKNWPYLHKIEVKNSKILTH